MTCEAFSVVCMSTKRRVSVPTGALPGMVSPAIGMREK